MMDLPPRKVLFCVSERALDNAAAFTWATKCLFEPRDAVTFVFVRVESGDTLVRGSCPEKTLSLFALSYAWNEDAPRAALR